MKLSRRQLTVIAVFCSALLVVVLWTLFFEYNRPWKYYQKEFAQLEERTAQNVPIKKSTENIRQLWLRELGEVDRCTTCHLGADTSGYEHAPQPYRTHSGKYLKQHPVETFGCVICHEGQGAALTVEDAHGEAENWPRPVLRGVFAQSSCGKCHGMDQSLPLDSELEGAFMYSYGWRLFHEYNCTGCHQLEGNERPDYIGPSLTSIGSKVNKDWLMKWLKNPKDYLPETRMPRFHLNDDEIEYVADYLMNPGRTGRGVLQYAPTDNASIKNGKALITSLGCTGCHMIGGSGNPFAPDLSDIGNKVTPAWLLPFLKNPEAYDPKSIVPDFMIPEDDITGVAAYLMSLAKNRANASVSGGHIISPDNAEKGEKLVKDLGCRGCHEIEKIAFQYNAPELDGMGGKRVDELFFGNIAGTKKDLISWLKLKIREPGRFNTERMIARMPDYTFNEEQAEALAVFLLGLHKDPVPLSYTRDLLLTERAGMRGKKIFEKYNCLGCHQLNREGGTLAPALTDAGKKFRPEWLFSFLRKPGKIRPPQVLKARMPDFHLSDKETSDIIEYLYAVSGEPYPFPAALKKEISPEDVPDGEKLYQEVFACSSCHTTGGRGGEVGPDHTDLASRVKREWLEQWMKDPQSIKPDVRMPKFTFKDWEFEALTNYLMTMGKYRFVQVKKSD